MKIERYVAGMVVAAFLAAKPGISASTPGTTGTVPAQMVVTVLPGQGGSRPQSLEAGELTVMQGKAPARVVHVQRLAGDLANMQLFVLLDDSTRSSSLGIHLPSLKTFLRSLPATTQVAVGYMRNGSFALTQSFTSDHQSAANSLRLPVAQPGENGSPYFALSDLVKRWPSKEATGRRAVLMLTDGVDRYYGTSIMDDPYVDSAIHEALKDGVLVYNIYLRGAGLYGRNSWVTNFAQSRLIEVSQETGGYSYFEAFTDPVSISPFLDDLHDRLENQYQVTIQAVSDKGVQPVKLKTETPGLKIEGPTRIYVR
jgi:hypothetical protein